MLTTDQVDHFRTFGFAVLRGYLASRIGVLRAEAGYPVPHRTTDRRFHPLLPSIRGRHAAALVLAGRS